MKISTNYLLRTLLRYCWIGLLAGLLLAGGFWLLRGHSTVPETPQAPEAGERLAPEDDPRLLRFALYSPDFSGYAQQAPQMGLNDYAASVAAFAAARFQTDAAYWEYYDAVFQTYPGLDPFVFTSDDMRPMITVTPYNHDVVMRVIVPELDEGQLAHCAEVMGLEDASLVPCRLRDTVFQAVCRAMDDPARLAETGVTLHRADPVYEQMMQSQSLAAAERAGELFAVKEGVLSGEGEASRPVGKKTLALVFLLGFALAEAIVALFVLLDPRVKDAADLRLNTDLPLLQTVPAGDSALTEAALRLGEGPAPAVLAVGVEQALAETLPARLEAGRKAAWGAEGASVLSGFQAADLGWLTALRDRPVVLALQTGKTTYDDLKRAADALSAARIDLRGAILLSPERKGTSWKG